QRDRRGLYRAALRKLWEAGVLYPRRRSRRDVAAAAGAPHGEDGAGEPVFPAKWRWAGGRPPPPEAVRDCNWRFRVPDGETVGFVDGNLGPRSGVAGADFGDFVVWRRDNLPGYQLACAADDAALGVTEVVRGADLVTSTFRQLLLLRALGARAPAYFHCELVRDTAGRRLAKRADALSLRELRRRGVPAEAVRGLCGEGAGAPPENLTELFGMLC
ncbi:MAG: tRNA glutamyl-Q synthetase, partial [Opitutaceae bacterium]|nr:tRNA glutamyl-Q synthetase [Opitutaceae bacterium]